MASGRRRVFLHRFSWIFDWFLSDFHWFSINFWLNFDHFYVYLSLSCDPRKLLQNSKENRIRHLSPSDFLLFFGHFFWLFNIFWILSPLRFSWWFFITFWSFFDLIFNTFGHHLVASGPLLGRKWGREGMKNQWKIDENYEGEKLQKICKKITRRQRPGGSFVRIL